MTSKEYDLIKEMLQMQKKLDEAIMKEYGLTEIDEVGYEFIGCEIDSEYFDIAKERLEKIKLF